MAYSLHRVNVRSCSTVLCVRLIHLFVEIRNLLFSVGRRRTTLEFGFTLRPGFE